MGGGQGDNTGHSEGFQYSGFGIGKLGHIVYVGKTIAANNSVEFYLDAPFNVRIPQHKHNHPQQRGLNSLHAGREEVAQNLFELEFCKQNIYFHYRHRKLKF